MTIETIAAEYEIRECPGTDSMDIVGRVTIDVFDNPHDYDGQATAIRAAGYDPQEQCAHNCGPRYHARCIGCAGPEVSIPVALLKQLVEVVNINQSASLSRDSGCVAVIGKTLQALGYVDRDGYYEYSTTDKLNEGND